MNPVKLRLDVIPDKKINSSGYENTEQFKAFNGVSPNVLHKIISIVFKGGGTSLTTGLTG